MENKKTLRNVLLYIGIPVLLIVLIAALFNSSGKESHNYSEIVGYFRNEQVATFEMDLGSGQMTITLKDGAVQQSSETPSSESQSSDTSGNGANSINNILSEMSSSSAQQSNNVIKYTAPNSVILYEEIKPYIDKYNQDNPDNPLLYNLRRPEDNSWIASLWPTLLLLAVMGFFWWYMIKKMSGAGLGGDKQMGFGKAKVKDMSDEKRKTTFQDVAGADEEKEELKEIVEFLKDPQKYNDLGARIPKGVLLVGSPGTGKTLLARAVAGEAGVPFFSISGSDFVEMFVGVGASRVRDLFAQAKKNAPCIIFIDEIDAVGRQRGAGLGGGHDEREQTLNQLLVEMDGFGANEGVIMIAATNRPDILDKALMRPGRFDRQIAVSLPDVKGREAILKVHSRKKPLAPDVNLKTIAQTTAGFTGADLENLLNEAALLSARENLKAITMPLLKEATIKVVVGTEKKSRAMNEREKRLTAFHEAGHAVTTYFCPTQDKVHQISIIPRGLAGGFTMSLPEEDRSYRSKKEMQEDIVVLLGGRVAESIVIGDISTGASNDIDRATQIATSMVTKFGMSQRLGPIKYGGDNNEVFIGRDMGHVKNYSENIASKIDEEVHKIVSACYDKTEKILRKHEDKLRKIADFLIEHEKMEASEFAEAMQDGGVDTDFELHPQPQT